MCVVYGSTIEPGGMELDHDSLEVECPACGAPNAIRRYWEACEGGCINNYKSLSCPECDHFEGDGSDNDDEFDGTRLSEFEMFPLDIIFEIASDHVGYSIDNICDAAIHDIKQQADRARESLFQSARYEP